MWQVVGFKIRESNGKKYCDIFLERDREGITGKEVKRGNYSMSAIDYSPTLGDTVIISEGSFNGRTYISDIIQY